MDIALKDWKIDMDITCIDDVLYSIIQSTVKSKCGTTDFGTAAIWETYGGGRVQIYLRAKCKFTYIHFNKDGELVAVNKNVPRNFIFRKNSKKVEKHIEDERIEDGIRLYVADSEWTNHGVSIANEQHLLETSAPIKWGAVIKALYPKMDEKTTSLVCDVLADTARTMFADATSVKVSDTPSAIYVIPSDFQSCMKDHRAEKFEIYDILPTIKIAYIAIDNRLKARALLHESTYYKKPIKIMDRIYAANSHYYASMKMWAIENGYWHKTKQSLDWNEFTDGHGNVKNFSCMKMPANEIMKGFIDVPYIDTFYRLLSDEHGNFWLGMKSARAGKVSRHKVDIRYASSRNIPPTLRSADARHCHNCHTLYYSKDLTVMKGYNIYFQQDTEESLCPSCLANLIPCPKCGEYHIWKSKRISGGMRSDSFNCYIDPKTSGERTEDLMCAKCRDRIKLTENGTYAIY